MRNHGDRSRIYPFVVAIVGGTALASGGCASFWGDRQPYVPPGEVVAKLGGDIEQPAPQEPDIISVPGATASTPVAPRAHPAPPTTVDAGYAYGDDGYEEPTAPRRPSAAPAKRSTAKRATSPSAGGSRTYVVQKGDTLQKISQKYYGTTKDWPKIFEANRGKLRKPDVIVVGQTLVIP